MVCIKHYRIDPILVLALSFVTCGLFHLYWNYRTAEDMNDILGTEVFSPFLALLCGLCLPLNVFFFYVLGRNLPEMARKADVQVQDSSLVLTILGLFLPMVAGMVAQYDLNRIYDKLLNPAP